MSTGSSPYGTPLQGVACDLCGSNRDQTLFTLRDMMQTTSDHEYRIARCRVCDLIYLNPRPYSWDIPGLYPAEYAPFKRSALGTLARKWLHKRTVTELANLVQAPRRVLDIGCGTGELLEQVRKSGNPNVLGIEPSIQAARVARENRGLDVRTGTLEQCALPDASIDTVLISHVLEHLPSPRVTLREVDRILRPGGAVVIWVPNAASVPAKVLGRYWMGWDVPRHLYAFTPGSLHRLIGTTSLQPGEILHEKHGIEWSWGLRLWAAERFENEQLNRALAALHPAMSIGSTPLGIISSLLRSSGRIRMIAWKPFD